MSIYFYELFIKLIHGNIYLFLCLCGLEQLGYVTHSFNPITTTIAKKNILIIVINFFYDDQYK